MACHNVLCKTAPDWVNNILIGNDVNSFLPKAYISILVALATLTPNGGETEGWMPLSMASVETN